SAHCESVGIGAIGAGGPATGFTTWFSTGDVLGLLFASPLYTALIGCVPTASVDVVNCALPDDSATGAPRFVAPSMNWTVPLGLPPVTVAVNVTAWPTSDGLTDDESVVVVGDTTALTT